MIRIKVDVKGLDMALARLAGMHKQVRFAAAVGLTRTAKAVMDEQQKILPRELDRPKPGTVRGMRFVKATPANLEATVMFRRRGEGVPAAEFIGHNISGGRRGMKRSEMMLRAAGILPAGLYTIPGKAAKRDAYGNMSRGHIVSILSFFKTFGNEQLKLNSPRMNRAKKSRSKAQYFVVLPGEKMPAGIWERTTKQAKPVLMFVNPGQHRKLVKFHETASLVVKRDWDRMFSRAFNDAMRTAR